MSRNVLSPESILDDYAEESIRLLNRTLTCAASGVLPTAAILVAEAVEERWCCPVCGGLNPMCADGAYAGGTCPVGYCQHELCVDRRREAAKLGGVAVPEILLPAFGYGGLAEDA